MSSVKSDTAGPCGEVMERRRWRPADERFLGRGGAGAGIRSTERRGADECARVARQNVKETDGIRRTYRQTERVILTSRRRKTGHGHGRRYTEKRRNWFACPAAYEITAKKSGLSKATLVRSVFRMPTTLLVVSMRVCAMCRY